MLKKNPKSSHDECHLLDFGGLWDSLQIFLEHQDFGVFLLKNGDQVVQQSDVSGRRGEIDWLTF